MISMAIVSKVVEGIKIKKKNVLSVWQSHIIIIEY